MPKPNIFISHRWDYNADYYQLIRKFDEYGFGHLDYSVPQHNPLDVNRKRLIAAGLQEQVRQCNYFIIFARMASHSDWCRHEVAVAASFSKPILAVRPYARRSADVYPAGRKSGWSGSFQYPGDHPQDLYPTEMAGTVKGFNN